LVRHRQQSAFPNMRLPLFRLKLRLAESPDSTLLKRWSMLSLWQLRKTLAERLTGPVIRFLARTSITPGAITWLGFIVSVAAAVLVAGGNLVAAGVLVLVAGFLDMLDGALARGTGRVTRFGAVLDSTLDRLSEAALLLGILFLFAAEARLAAVLLVGITLTGSQLVSYIRARAEALGLEPRAGLFTRPERVIVLALGLLLNQLVIALVVIAVFSFFTVGQRLVDVHRQLKIR